MPSMTKLASLAPSLWSEGPVAVTICLHALMAHRPAMMPETTHLFQADWPWIVWALEPQSSATFHSKAHLLAPPLEDFSGSSARSSTRVSEWSLAALRIERLPSTSMYPLAVAQLRRLYCGCCQTPVSGSSLAFLWLGLPSAKLMHSAVVETED
eukprot:CAMPEP_0117461204 /NCGR_PEP_ID=MMETSP0784-20121206/2402_1 /TAXON_ID=39447 /ORGANISM="" /LENGTH=153 /DNA_ID=CAMNT_0005254899 /DNA_START=889 /DNA_END=1347 /DNA_ORIENTATION=+